VVDETHRQHLGPLVERARLGRIIYQPSDRGTATGVLLAVAEVSTCSPDAVVILSPSDHGVANEEAFRGALRSAIRHVADGVCPIVLMGAEAQSVEDGYGWIVPGPGPGEPRPVVTFVEKPSAIVAEELCRSGAVWNTMVLVAKAGAILSLFRQHAPDLVAAFEGLRFLAADARCRQAALIYDHLPTVDFSRHVIARARGLSCLSWRASVGWTDLGTPGRLSAWLSRNSLTPPRPEAVGDAVALP
jgi:mannose-1-phosphate guanylyltransferase